MQPAAAMEPQLDSLLLSAPALRDPIQHTMTLRPGASRVLQALQQRGLLLPQARAFSELASDAIDSIYSSARPPTVCFLGPPVRAEGFLLLAAFLPRCGA